MEVTCLNIWSIKNFLYDSGRQSPTLLVWAEIIPKLKGGAWLIREKKIDSEAWLSQEYFSARGMEYPLLLS